MGILIGLALGIGVLFYFTIIKKNKQVDTNNSGDIPNTSSCKRLNNHLELREVLRPILHDGILFLTVSRPLHNYQIEVAPLVDPIHL